MTQLEENALKSYCFSMIGIPDSEVSWAIRSALDTIDRLKARVSELELDLAEASEWEGIARSKAKMLKEDMAAIQSWQTAPDMPRRFRYPIDPRRGLGYLFGIFWPRKGNHGQFATEDGDFGGGRPEEYYPGMEWIDPAPSGKGDAP